MARGWESKSIEQQIEDARTDPHHASPANPTPAEIALQQRREGLLLQRTQILQEINSARNPRYQEVLGNKLRFIDEQLSGQ